MMMMMMPSSRLAQPLLSGSDDRDSVASADELLVPGGQVQVSNLRCKNCAQWYPAAGAEREDRLPLTLCQYHPGRYNLGISKAMGHCGWSCCKNVNKSAPGCKHAQHHVEDSATTQAVMEFLSQQRGSGCEVSELTKELENRVQVAQAEASNPSVGTSRGALGENSQVHVVQPSDTIQGISLRYGVSVHKLKALNALQTDAIFPYRTLLVPADDNDTVRRPALSGAKPAEVLYAQMKAEGPSSMQEAAAYLAMADDDVEEALALWKEDLEWAQKEKPDSVAQ